MIYICNRTYTYILHICVHVNVVMKGMLSPWQASVEPPAPCFSSFSSDGHKLGVNPCKSLSLCSKRHVPNITAVDWCLIGLFVLHVFFGPKPIWFSTEILRGTSAGSRLRFGVSGHLPNAAGEDPEGFNLHSNSSCATAGDEMIGWWMNDDGWWDEGSEIRMILVHRYWIERTVGIWGLVEIKKTVAYQ